MNVNDCVRRTQIVYEKYAKYAVEKRKDIHELARGRNAYDMVHEQLSNAIKILEERLENIHLIQPQYRGVEQNKLTSDVRMYTDRKHSPIRELERIKRRANMVTGNNWINFSPDQEVKPTTLKNREDEIKALYKRVDDLQRVVEAADPNARGLTAAKAAEEAAKAKEPGFFSGALAMANFPFGGANESDSMKAPAKLPAGLISPTPNFYMHTPETENFEKNWLAAKQKQDIQLEKIEQGISQLDNIAKQTRDTLMEQTPLLEEVDQVVQANLQLLRTNNKRMAEQIDKVANSRAFCCYTILIILLMGVCGYLYTMMN